MCHHVVLWYILVCDMILVTVCTLYVYLYWCIIHMLILPNKDLICLYMFDWPGSVTVGYIHSVAKFNRVQFTTVYLKLLRATSRTWLNFRPQLYLLELGSNADINYTTLTAFIGTKEPLMTPPDRLTFRQTRQNHW